MGPMTANDQPDPVEDETKRRFREALQAKQSRHRPEQHDDQRGQGHAHGPVETKRTFRRKTG